MKLTSRTCSRKFSCNTATHALAKFITTNKQQAQVLSFLVQPFIEEDRSESASSQWWIQGIRLWKTFGAARRYFQQWWGE